MKTYSGALGGIMEITTQADYYGLPERTTPPAPPVAKVADQLAAPQNWQGPSRLDSE